MNLQSSVIAILLAAIGALAGIFYGGPLFTGGSVGAQANNLVNASNNVASAYVAYVSDRPGQPVPTVDDLRAAGALKANVQLDGMIKDGTTMAIHPELGVVAAVATKTLCERIDSNLKLPSAVTTTVNATTATTASAVLATGILSGCFKTSQAVAEAGATNNDYIYFQRT